MPPAHTHSPAGSGLEIVLAVVVLMGLAVAYVLLASRRAREPRGWSRWRTASFLAGIGLLVAALLPGLSPFPTGDFRGHMYQHLVIGMYAPLGLVLGAPITLILRSVPHRTGRLIGRLLRSKPLAILTHPVTALILNLGGLYLLYFTQLYAATADSAFLHHVVHIHFLAAGYLFAYAIAGPDPAPHRPSVPFRLVILGVAITAHAVLAQWMYAGAFVRVDVPEAELRGAADLMYYGGDIAELLLAFAMVATWRPRRSPGREVDRLPVTRPVQDRST